MINYLLCWILFLSPFFLSAQSSSIIGSAALNEYPYGICADAAGNVYFGATSNDDSWIFKRDVSNNIIWSRKLNTIASGFSSDVSYIDIVGDTIFGCGWLKTGNLTEGALFFKLNATTGAPYWVKSESTSNSYFSSMRYANGKYFLSGSQMNNANNATGYNGKVMAVSSLNGSIIWQTSSLGLTFPGFGVDYIDDFLASTEMVNGQMFITGRSYVNATSTNMRAVLIGINDMGTIFLHKYLEFNASSSMSARFYGISIEYDGPDSLIVLQYGDDDCTGCTDFKAGLVKTDLSGNVSWCKEYDLNGIATEVGRGINVTPNSYVFYGFANLNQNNSKMFAVKTSKTGVFQVAKLISLGTGNLGHISGPVNCGGSGQYKNGKHYIPGAYFTTNANSRDIAQIVLDDNLEDPLSCLTISPVSVTTSSYPPFSNVLNLNVPPDVLNLNLQVSPIQYPYVSACNASVGFTQNSNCDSSVITAIAPAISNPSFVWSNGAVGNTTTAFDTDTLFVYISNPLTCCVVVDTIIPVLTTTTLFAQLPNDTTICLSQNGSFTLTPNVPPNSGALSYQWNNLSQNNSLSVSQSGTYWVSVSNGCQTAIDSINLVIAALPAPVITASGPLTFCTGGSVTLSSSYPTGNTWSTGQTSQVITVNTPGTITLFTTSNGCVSPSTSIVLTEINASLPTAQLSGGGTFCQGQNIAPVTVSFTGSGPWTLAYQLNGVNQTPITTANSTYDLGQNAGTYLLTTVLDVNCTNTVTDTSLIVINPIPTIDLSPLTLCVGSAGTLSTTVSLPGGTYLWSPTGETTASINVAPLATSTYVVVYTLNNCPSLPDTAVVVVNALPVVSFSADTLIGCAPLSVNFTGMSNGDPNTCFWTLSNGQTLSGCNPSYTFNQPGCFDVTFTSSLNGCSSSASISQYICIENSPIALFVANPNAINPDNSTVYFVNLSSGAVAYHWDFGDGTQSSEVSPLHLFNANGGTYQVTLTATSSLGCISEYTIAISYEEDLVFYVPNSFTPDGDQFNQVFTPIFSSGIDQSSYHLSIYNRWGELIFESYDLQTGWDGTYQIENGLVQDGIYVWKIDFKLKDTDDRRLVTGHVNVLK
jgi:gliding motility-associated-like protein